MKLKHLKKRKIFFSMVPIGSIFFGEKNVRTKYYNYNDIILEECEYLVTKQLEDLEQPKLFKIEQGWVNEQNEPIEHKACICAFTKYVKYEDIKTYGLKYCIKKNIYTEIDIDYIRKVENLRNIKTLKALKILLEYNLLG